MLQQIPNGVAERDEFSTIEAGKILFGNENVEIQTSKAGNLMIRVSLRGIQPAAIANLPHFHYFNIGEEGDPGADKPETWLKNSGRFKTFCMACNVPFDGYPVVTVVQNLIGKHIGAHIKTKIRQSKPGEDNRYDGQPEASVAKWLTPGNFQPELDSQVGGGQLGLTMPQTQPQANVPPAGTGAFAPPGGVVQPANPGMPANQAPLNVPAQQPAQQTYEQAYQQTYEPPANAYAPAGTPQTAPTGPPATPGMDSGQYVPQNQPAPVVPGQPPVVPGQPGAYNPYQQPGAGVPNPTLPPGVM